MEKKEADEEKKRKTNIKGSKAFTRIKVNKDLES